MRQVKRNFFLKYQKIRLRELEAINSSRSKPSKTRG